MRGLQELFAALVKELVAPLEHNSFSDSRRCLQHSSITYNKNLQ